MSSLTRTVALCRGLKKASLETVHTTSWWTLSYQWKRRRRRWGSVSSLTRTVALCRGLKKASLETIIMNTVIKGCNGGS